MKHILVVCLVLMLSPVTNVKAQTSAKSVYFELGGAGLASVNYDMRLQKKDDGLGFKVGVGGFSVDGTTVALFPVGLNYLLGKDGRNYFEMGLGVTFVAVRDRYSFNGGSVDDNFTTTFGHAFFGYRLQPKDGGFLFRAGVTPVFNKDGFVPYWAGVSFGYKF